ncbi:ATP-binding protein [Altererythrobacter sp. H2]|uniref:sensor histidine kinase n=1 Tax=Altererythrobacter sp. H2 TaxID=3108391 RepID=UPI002B4BF076|nr:ATP-binding protein [Altererythrobacter sp. H2]WRK97329.1 ATP-binding protein [Altererythrobacter sp. H2]
MEPRSPLPLAGLLIALLTAVSIWAAGVGLWLSAVILLVWLGTLWLAGSNPPPARERTDDPPISRDRMSGLIENSSAPVLLVEKGRVTVANRSAREALGQHILGQDARVVFRQPAAIKLLDRAKNGSATVRGLVRRRDIWRLNLQLLSETLSVVELVNMTGEADISRAHTDFVANASHELRTPLASIIGYVETLMEDDGDLSSDTRARFLKTILSEANRLQSLVSDLMSLSRVEAEKHDAPGQTIALRQHVVRAAKDAAGPDRQHRLLIEGEQDFSIEGDPRQIEQLVRNLVDNALKYGADSESVVVTLDEAPSGDARLTVRDFGDGIAPEHLPHLTRRFYRTDPGRSRASGGTGLGLAIVKHIAERHRARLDIASVLGDGTSVTVRFPVVKADAEPLS